MSTLLPQPPECCDHKHDPGHSDPLDITKINAFGERTEDDVPSLDPTSMGMWKQSSQVVLRSEPGVQIGASTDFLTAAASDSWKDKLCVSIVSI